MSDLVAFLRARLDEDERYARFMIEYGERRAAGASEQDLASGLPFVRQLMSDPVLMGLLQQWKDRKPPNDLHRVLSEVEFKRGILREVEPTTYLLHGMAAVYRDHQDYRPEWR